jgi:L-2-hydroxyglutarate oxidase LhgO
MTDYAAVVIGAGVVGLACAERLSRDGRPVLIVDRRESFGRETSSRNSEVVHAGMYYPTGSLKARLCVPGARSLYAWCERHGVAFARIGKHIVATSRDEEPKLEEIRARGDANGVEGLQMLSARALAAREPHVNATAALWSPHTGIVDSHGLMASLLAEARAHGADVAWKHEFTEVEPIGGGGYRLVFADPSGGRAAITTRVVVNAAGLFCDEVAARAGIDVDAAGYRLTWVKGRYFRLRGRGRVSTLIYPVPPPDLVGLGIHVTLGLDGSARLGPDTQILAERRLDYDVPESAGDIFFRAASRYLRGLGREDLSPDHAGIRPKLVPKEGGVPDFVIAEESARGLPGWVNLIGIESPGLTCALEIGALVASLVP